MFRSDPFYARWVLTVGEVSQVMILLIGILVTALRELPPLTRARFRLLRLDLENIVVAIRSTV